jgi:hypothetical protein
VFYQPLTDLDTLWGSGSSFFLERKNWTTVMSVRKGTMEAGRFLSVLARGNSDVGAIGEEHSLCAKRAYL